MALPRDRYRELEDILGEENISEDLAVIDTYAYTGWHTIPLPDPRPDKRFSIRPEAVVLPGSTQDVQAVIKWCNRHRVTCRALSTGYGMMNVVSHEGEIILDLRRMNHILDIDEKNMFIIVEPFVSCIQVQVEANKRGLCCNVVGAGSQVSFLASCTSVGGNNTLGISQSTSGRNLLGVEWVLPTGEIVRVGAPGSGAGWFSGDGPGPSLRGIIRGVSGALGGLGVFTKCAGHLRPWPGPKEMKITGVSPYYETEVPPLFEYHVLEWPTWGQCAEGVSKIGEAGIGYSMHKTGGPGSHGSCVTGNNNEYYEKRMAGKLLIPDISLALVMAANSQKEHEFQVETLDKILADTGGKIIPVGEEPEWKNRDYIGMIKACFVPRAAFRVAGNFTNDGFVGNEGMHHCGRAIEFVSALWEKWRKTGAFFDDGTTNNWAAPYENTHLALQESGRLYDPTDEKSCKTALQMLMEGARIAAENTIVSTPYAPEGWAEVGPNVLGWVRKIKKALDPNAVSDAAWYVMAEEK